MKCIVLPLIFFRHRVLVTLLLLSIVALLFYIRYSAAAPAASVHWERVDDGLPAVAPVLSLAAIPEQPNHIYAGTYRLPGLWHSMDGGETWSRVGPTEAAGPENQAVNTVLWDADHQCWWAGTAGGLFVRPADSPGWQPVAELDGPIFSLALDEAGRLYAVMADDGLFLQEQNGGWKRLRQEARPLAVGLAPTGQHIFLGTAGHGLWISHNGGNTWLQGQNFSEEYISTLLVDPKEGRWVYAGTSKQLYRSADYGYTWQPVPALAERAYALAWVPSGTIYAGLEGRVARSQDGGLSWSISNQGLSPHMPVFDLFAVRRPRDDDLVYAATRDGLYRSTDQGQTWQRRSTGLGGIEVDSLAWDGTGGMIAATPLGLYRRSPGEGLWEPAALGFKYKRFYEVSSHPTLGVIYAGMQSGLVRSTDRGQTWQEVVSDLTSHGMPGVWVDPKDADHIFIRLAFERIYESHDSGQSWHARWAGMESHHEVLAMARSPAGELWAGTQEGLFIWDSQREQWRREPFPSPDESIFAITFAPASQAAYVGATGGLWCRGEDSHWRQCAGETIHHTVTALATLLNDHIYAGTRYAGLYQSCNGGHNWHQVSGIPHTVTVNALLVDTDDELVYVATDHGLFRGNDTNCSMTETSLWGRVWQGLKQLIPRARDALESLLATSGPYPPLQPLPAIHTLRANDTLLRQANEIGFRAVVQVLSWQEIEPTRGEWHWEYPDFLLQATEFYDLDLFVRLDHPPTWARQATSEPINGRSFPFDEEAYLKFVASVAQRYQGRIWGYIIWNEPNLAREWGGPPDPVEYTRLLRRAYEVIKQQDPEALVISAGLSPTNAQPGSNEQAIDDRLFLEEMYRAGAQPFFEAMGAHPYGFAYSPDDPHGAHSGLNMNRLLDLRAIMKAYGDEAKSVWATEVGWTTRGTGEHSWLTVTPEEQTNYLVRAWNKAQTEFPWLHVFTVWNLSQDLPEQDEKAGYSLLDEDGLPKPACGALKEAFAEANFGRGQFILLKLLTWLPTTPSTVSILARDEEIHLGDSE